MRIILRLMDDTPPSEAQAWDPRYPRGPMPFVVSLALHVMLVAGTFAIGRMEFDPPVRVRPLIPGLPPKKVVLIVPLELRLPKVSPPAQLPTANQNQGTTPTKLQAALTDPMKRRVRQFVLNEAPPVLRARAPAPDLIRAPMPMEPPVPKPVPPPKQFVPPTLTPVKPQPADPLVNAADIPILAQSDSKNLPKLVLPAGAPRPAAPPRMLEAPPEVAGNSSSSAMAILNLSPAPNAPAPPSPPAQAGQLSRAEVRGTPAVRKTEDNGLKLPGVAVDRGNVPAIVPPGAAPPPVTPPAPAPVPEVRYRLSQLGAAQNSVSVPLRPFTRQVSREIEKAFSGRNVYSLLVPMAGMDAYRGDWVVWFGERAPTADGRVSAPLPLAQKVAVKTGNGSVTESRIRAHFVIGTDGSASGVTISSSSESSLAARAAEDLKLWRFRPAAKNGVPFEADVVLEYWFRASSQ